MYSPDRNHRIVRVWTTMGATTPLLKNIALRYQKKNTLHGRVICSRPNTNWWLSYCGAITRHRPLEFKNLGLKSLPSISGRYKVNHIVVTLKTVLLGYHRLKLHVCDVLSWILSTQGGLTKQRKWFLSALAFASSQKHFHSPPTRVCV